MYAAARSIASRFKASHHATGDWRIAFQHVAAGGARLPPGLPRVVHRFPPAKESAPGVTRAFTLATPWFAVRPQPEDATPPASTFWIDPPAEGQSVECLLVITTPAVRVTTWPGSNKGTHAVTHLDLPDGRTLWVVYQIGTVTGKMLEQWRVLRERGRAAVEGSGELLDTLTVLGMGQHGDDGSWYFLDLPLGPEDGGS